MKNYYQQKKDGWHLEPVIYAKTVKQIQCYRHFQDVLDSKESEADGIRHRLVAERYIHAVDRGLRRHVPTEYQEAVFAHVVDGVKYADLEEQYYISRSTMKRYAQIFVWCVADELGENF